MAKLVRRAEVFPGSVIVFGLSVEEIKFLQDIYGGRVFVRSIEASGGSAVLELLEEGKKCNYKEGGGCPSCKSLKEGLPSCPSIALDLGEIFKGVPVQIKGDISLTSAVVPASRGARKVL